jgi:hypothetical protein
MRWRMQQKAQFCIFGVHSSQKYKQLIWQGPDQKEEAILHNELSMLLKWPGHTSVKSYIDLHTILFRLRNYSTRHESNTPQA